MGCTPSKANIAYSHEHVCGDLDTCSTFLPSVISSVSTPERPSTRLRLDTGANGRETFLTGKIGEVYYISLLLGGRYFVLDCLHYNNCYLFITIYRLSFLTVYN